MIEIDVEGAASILTKLDAMQNRLKELHKEVPELAQKLAEPPEGDEATLAEVHISGRGANIADLFGNIHRGVELHPSLLRLAAKLFVSGRKPDEVIATLYKAMDSSSAPHDLRWAHRRADIPRLVRTAQKYTVRPKHKRRRRKIQISGSILVPETSGHAELTGAVSDHLVQMAREAMTYAR
jgi:hypothetical protein